VERLPNSWSQCSDFCAGASGTFMFKRSRALPYASVIAFIAIGQPEYNARGVISPISSSFLGHFPELCRVESQHPVQRGLPGPSHVALQLPTDASRPYPLPLNTESCTSGAALKLPLDSLGEMGIFS